jgi:hypothetical protein
MSAMPHPNRTRSLRFFCDGGPNRIVALIVAVLGLAQYPGIAGADTAVEKKSPGPNIVIVLADDK